MSRIAIAILLLAPFTAAAQDDPYAPSAGTDDQSRTWDEERDDERIAGWTRDSKGHPQPIINGDSADTEDFPSSGGLVVEGGAFGLSAKLFMCSSTLIAPDVVLTAAHCTDVVSLAEQQYGITLDFADFYFTRAEDLSRYNFGFADPLPEDAAFGPVLVWHDDFPGAAGLRGPLGDNSDIGLIFLDAPLTDVPLAVLPTFEEAELIAEGDAVWAVGWGQQEQDGEVMGLKQQGESFINDYAAYEFQVGAIQTDVRKCHGDSGGPTYWEAPESEALTTRRQIGITSHSYDGTDCQFRGGVDTNVAYYLDWIDDQLVAGCEDGTRSWCPEDEDGNPLTDQWGVLPPPEPEPEVVAGACGCQSNPTHGTGVWAAALALLALRRRSR